MDQNEEADKNITSLGITSPPTSNYMPESNKQTSNSMVVMLKTNPLIDECPGAIQIQQTKVSRKRYYINYPELNTT